MAERYKDLYRPPSSRANSKPRTIITRATSPEEEAAYWQDDPGNPAEAWMFAGSTARVANTARDTADWLSMVGNAIIAPLQSIGKDVLNVVAGAATGEFPYEPGPIAGAAAGVAERLYTTMPTGIQKALTPDAPRNAGWIRDETTGKTYIIPAEQDAQAAGEKAQTTKATAALRPTTQDLTPQLIAARTAKATLDQRESEFQRNMEVKARQEARADDLWTLQKELLEQEIDRRRPTQKQLQYWWMEPDTQTPATAAKKTIQAIGTGVAGTIRVGTMPY